MTTQQIDQAKAEAFGGQVVGILNGGSLTFMLSIGHRTGLFDTLATMSPSTSAEIAKAAGLNERYVREWLGAMVCGGIIDYNATAETYTLPAEHAVSLTRAAGPGNLASFAGFFSEIGNVETKIVGSFQNGGGVPYSDFPRFQELMAEESAQVFDATLIQSTLTLPAGLVDRLREGIDVADVGCGSGHAINLMAKEFPKSRFTGFDFSEEGVAVGRAEAKTLGVKNAKFEERDAAKLGEREKFDFITSFDSVHDQAKPADMLRCIYEALRPGGTYLCVDIAASSRLQDNIPHPMGPFLYTISTMHCMTVSLAYGGEGLGTVWGEQKAKEMLAAAGFKDITVQQVEGDILNNYYIATK